MKEKDLLIGNAWNKVLLARKITRFRALDMIHAIFDSFIELHGDRGIGEDRSIIGGIALIEGQPVTVIGQQKGNDIKSMEYSMPFR